ncbi:MAG: hypothetical protein IJ529_04890 [Alphaproteobacteria bacterium]|nr:hypothetical protein [Alphaproteobacteria bacterium]
MWFVFALAVIYLSVIWIMLIGKWQKQSTQQYPQIAKKWIFTLLAAAIILILAVD